MKLGFSFAFGVIGKPERASELIQESNGQAISALLRTFIIRQSEFKTPRSAQNGAIVFFAVSCHSIGPPCRRLSQEAEISPGSDMLMCLFFCDTELLFKRERRKDGSVWKNKKKLRDILFTVFSGTDAVSREFR